MPRTPRHATGTIRAYRRADGGTSWKAVVKYPDPDDPQRWRQRAQTFATRAEAKAWLDAALTEHRSRPQFRPPSGEAFGTYLTRWLDEVAAGRVRGATTLASYRHMAWHLIDRLGAKPLAQLTPLDFQGVYTALAQAGRAANTIRRVHAVAHKALADAVDLGLLPTNPADRAKPPAGRCRASTRPR